MENYWSAHKNFSASCISSICYYKKSRKVKCFFFSVNKHLKRNCNMIMRYHYDQLFLQDFTSHLTRSGIFSSDIIMNASVFP